MSQQLKQISPLQLFIIVVNISFGIGIVTLPRSVATAAQEDMWISVLLGGVVFTVSFWVAARLAGYFSQYTFIEYYPILLGPVLGNLFNVIHLALMLMVIAISLRSFGMTVKMFLLSLTPPVIIVVAVLAMVVYSGQYGLGPFVRMQHFLFVPSYAQLIFYLSFGVLAIDTKHYLPLLANGFTPIVQGIVPSWFSYTGSELVIGLLYPFLTRPHYTFKWGGAGIVFIIVLYTTITAITQGILGPKVAAHLLIPTIIAYRDVEIPDTFIERLDGYLMIGWVPLYFMTVANYSYFISYGVSRLLKLEGSRQIIVLLMPIIYYLTVLPPDTPTIDAINKTVNIAGLVWGLVVLPFLLGLAWLKEKRRNLC